MTVVAETWRALLKEERREPGWHVRRVYPNAPCEILAGILQPGGWPGLLLEVSVDDVPAGVTLPKSRGFEVNPILHGGVQGRVRFALKLSDRVYEAVFSVLCDDTARAAGQEVRARSAVRAWINRLRVWQEFMALYGAEGLSEKAVLGLLGELLVMRDLLVPRGIGAAVHAWAGPLGEPNDFSLSKGYIEVKTTARQAPALIEVSGVDQLDDTRGSIVLTHVQLRPSPEGEALPQVVAALRSALVHEDADRLRTFDQLLMAAGYIDAQAYLYTDRYKLQSLEFFQVTGGFPRIRRQELPDGIRELTYSVELVACAPYRLHLQEVVDLFWALKDE